MGIMTELTLSYFANPLAGTWTKFKKALVLMGYNRAIGHMNVNGFADIAENLIKERDAFRKS